MRMIMKRNGFFVLSVLVSMEAAHQIPQLVVPAAVI